MRIPLYLLTIFILFPRFLEAETIRYSYDSRNQLVGVDQEEGSSIEYAYDAAGNLLSREVRTENNSLYFPFCQADAGTFLGMALSNYSDEGISIDLYARDSSGALANYGQNPAHLDLAGGRQVARTAAEIFKAGSVQDSWVEVSAGSADLGSFFQFGNGSLTQLDGSIALDHHYRDFYFTRVYQGATAFRGQRAVTQLSIANPTDQAVVFDLKLLSTEDSAAVQTSSELQPTAVVERTLPPKGFLYEDVGRLFGLGNISGGYVAVRIKQGGGLVAFQLLELPDRTTAIGLNAHEGNLSTTLYSAQLAEASSIYTNLKLINLSDQPRKVRITAVGNQGDPLEEPRIVRLSPGRYLEEDVADLLRFDASAELIVGSLMLETDGPGIIGDVVFGDPTRFKYAASMPLQTRKLMKAVFSQVATTASFFTGLAFYNPDLEPTELTLRVFNAAGKQKGTWSQILPPGNRMSGLIPELVPSASTVVGGYIVIESTRPLIAQQIFGQAQLNQFSAVPPKIVR